MKSIRILSVVILALAVLVACFASCGKKADNAESTKGTTEEIKTTVVITEKVETVTDESGEAVTEEGGAVVTEIVTEKEYVPVDKDDDDGKTEKSTTAKPTTKVTEKATQKATEKVTQKTTSSAEPTKDSGGGVVLATKGANSGWY